MGFRFRKSIKIIPGLRLNIGLRRASLSVGGRGLIYNVGSKGSRVTASIPGSGLSYSTSVSHPKPVNLVANSIPARRRYSATPFVIVAFLFGLVYIIVQSISQSGGGPKAAEGGTLPAHTDVIGSIAKSIEEFPAVEPPIPLPRPRPKVRIDAIGPPLQILPQE